MTQNDIKRVIAYSTCSQLGYMFFAAGVSAYGAAMFHLMTHAFFKALLFLGAGSVIHAMSGEQDMRKMGGISLSRAQHLYPDVDRHPGAGRHRISVRLRRLLFQGHDPRGGLRGRHRRRHVRLLARHLAAFFTAFYSWRLLFMTFHGKSRADHEVMHHAHESPPVMLWPLVVLAVGAIFAGYLGYNLFRRRGHERSSGARRSSCCPQHDSRRRPRSTCRSGSASCRWLIGLLGIVMAWVAYIWHARAAGHGGARLPPDLPVLPEQMVFRRALRFPLRAAG